MKKITLSFLVTLIFFPCIIYAGGNKSGGKSELNFWNWDPEMKSENTEVLQRFEEANPGISVKMTVLEPKDYWTKIRVAANQKKLPDVFYMSSGYSEEWVENDLLYPLDDYIKNDLDQGKYNMNAFAATRKIANSGKVDYLYPFAMVVVPLFYNRDLFDEAGVPYPEDNWTWEDFLDKAAALTKDKDGDGTPDQWGYWFYGRYAHVDPWVIANKGRLIDRSTMSYAPDANAVEALNFLFSLVNEHKVAPQKKIMDAFRQQDVFPQQAAAMWVDGSWNIDHIQKSAKDAFEWGIAMPPKGPQGDGRQVNGWPDSIAIAANTKNPDLAWELLKHVGGEGLNAGTLMAGKLSSFKPLNADATTSVPGEMPYNKELLAEMLEMDILSTFTKGWGEWRGYGPSEQMGLNGIIDGIIDGVFTVEEGMTKADGNINTILERIYK